MPSKEELLQEKQRIEEQLNRISFVDDRGQRHPIKPEFGSESGEDASEVEEFANRMTLVRELASALSGVEDKLAQLA